MVQIAANILVLTIFIVPVILKLKGILRMGMVIASLGIISNITVVITNGAMPVVGYRSNDEAKCLIRPASHTIADEQSVFYIWRTSSIFGSVVIYTWRPWVTCYYSLDQVCTFFTRPYGSSSATKPENPRTVPK